MVSVEEFNGDVPMAEDVPASEERRLDAEEIEKAAATMTRPTTRMHLEALAKKLRKESEALKRVEKSRELMYQENTPPSNNETMKVEEIPSSEPTKATMDVDQQSKPVSPPAPSTASTPASPPPLSAGMRYVPIDKFAMDFGGYNAPFVTLYVNLAKVGSIPRDQISCKFTANSFDLIVKDLEGKSYRLFKDNLDKDILPDKSKIIVKADKILIKLGKVKSEYGSYDFWNQLTAKKTKKDKDKAKDPQASIMDMMKDMYESGDDNMKKIIGETMMKQRNGELGDGMGGGMGDLGMDDAF